MKIGGKHSPEIMERIRRSVTQEPVLQRWLRIGTPGADGRSGNPFEVEWFRSGTNGMRGNSRYD
jgi:hypothetical protein